MKKTPENDGVVEARLSEVQGRLTVISQTVTVRIANNVNRTLKAFEVGGGQVTRTVVKALPLTHIRIVVMALPVTHTHVVVMALPLTYTYTVVMALPPTIHVQW